MGAGLVAWLHSDLRRRARALVALAVLFGLAASVPAAALAGARRAGSAFTRAEVASRAPHASIERGGPTGMSEDALAEARSLPVIEASTTVDLLLMRPVGTELFLAFDLLVYSPRDEVLGEDIARAHIVDGRDRRAGAPDEVIVDETAAKVFDLEVGSTLTLESWTNEARDQAFFDVTTVPAPDGPVVDTTVVGIYRDPQTLAADDVPPSVITTSSFHAEHVGEDPDHGAIGSWPGIMFVRLVEGATLDDLGGGLAEIERRHGAQPGQGFDVGAPDHGADTSDEARAQVLALQLFAAAAAAAGLFIAGQAMARHAYASSRDLDTLRMLGATSVQRTVAAAAPVLPVVAGGAALATVLAWAGSAVFPLGTPGRVEPDRGLALDAGVVLGVTAGAAAVLVLWAVGAGWTMTRRRGARQGSGISPAGRLIGRLAPRAPITVGLRMAFEGGSGRVRVPVGPALVGVVVGLAGVTAALLFNGSLHHLLRSPELYGWGADAYVRIDTDRATYDELALRLGDDPRVARFSGEVDVVLEAAAGAPSQFLDGSAHVADAGPPLHTLLEGRFPTGANEIALGPRLADEWGVGLGDSVGFVGREGGDISLVVVGLMIQPQTSFDLYDYRFTMPSETAERIAAAPDAAGVYGMLVEYAGGAEAAVEAELEGAGFLVIGRDERRSPIASLGEVDLFPLALAAFLGVLAVGFLAHALAVASRQRTREIGLLKTIGFSKRQLAAAVVWHATAVAAVGILVGLPLGLAIGRAAFELLVDSVHVGSNVVVPVSLLAAAAGAFLLANLMAVVPARRAARTPAAAELRAD